MKDRWEEEARRMADDRLICDHEVPAVAVALRSAYEAGRKEAQEEALAYCHARNFQWCAIDAPAWPWVKRTRDQIRDAIRTPQDTRLPKAEKLHDPAEVPSYMLVDGEPMGPEHPRWAQYKAFFAPQDTQEDPDA